MKRLMLISCLLISSSFCVQAKRTPFDPNSPSSFLTSLIVLTTTFSGYSSSSSTSSSIPSLSYSTQTYSFYVGEIVSISASTSNVTSCSVNSTLPTGLSLNTATCSISGTAGGTSSSKSYTIIGTGNGGSTSANLTIAVDPVYRIYMANNPVFGNVTLSTADTNCNSDINRPSSGTYKAMLVSSTRRACSNSFCFTGVGENLNWVFKASTNYVRVDGTTLIGKTNDAGIFWDGNSITLKNGFSTASQPIWSGMNSDFTNSSNNCTNWTSNSVGIQGQYGISNLTSSGALNISSATCNNIGFLICVEQ